MVRATASRLILLEWRIGCVLFLADLPERISVRWFPTVTADQSDAAGVVGSSRRRIGDVAEALSQKQLGERQGNWSHGNYAGGDLVLQQGNEEVRVWERQNRRGKGKRGRAREGVDDERAALGKNADGKDANT